jgi:hypothetical protein
MAGPGMALRGHREVGAVEAKEIYPYSLFNSSFDTLQNTVQPLQASKTSLEKTEAVEGLMTINLNLSNPEIVLIAGAF